MRIATAELYPGMKLGRSLHAADGRVLLHGGAELKDQYINILKRMAIPAVYIINDLAPDIEPATLISEQTRRQATTVMREALTEMARAAAGRGTGSMDTRKLNKASEALVSDVVCSPRQAYGYLDLRVAEESLAAHSVNVAVICVNAGLGLGYTVPQLQELSLGCLLHDVGKAAVPQELLQKKNLTPEERSVVEGHTTQAWEILSKQSSISFVSAAVALQHHERFSGGGYPRGIHGRDIHEFARLCAIADWYDTLTSDIPGRSGSSPHLALRFVEQLSDKVLDGQLVKVVSESLAPYPVGTMVELTGGLRAIVTEVAPGKGYQPRVRIVQGPNGERIAEPKELLLADRPPLRVVRPLRPESWAPISIEDFH